MQDKDPVEELARLFSELGITIEDLTERSDKLCQDKKNIIGNIVKQVSDNDFGDGFKVGCGVDDPLPGTGFVRLQGDVINIKDIETFSDVCFVSNAIEMFVENGKAVVEFTISNARAK